MDRFGLDANRSPTLAHSEACDLLGHHNIRLLGDLGIAVVYSHELSVVQDAAKAWVVVQTLQQEMDRPAEQDGEKG